MSTHRAIITAACVSVLALCAVTLRAQNPPDGSVSFEVASIKPSNPDPGNILASIPMVMPPVGGRFSARNVPLRHLIRIVYDVQDFQIVGGPSWQTTSTFDITAKAPDGFAGDMKAVFPMVKTLLADRFKLKTHTETREMPIYALVIAQSDGALGPDMSVSTSDCSNAEARAKAMADAFAKGGAAAISDMMPKPGETMPCAMMPAMDGGGFGLRANGQKISVLTQLLTRVTGRIVQDKTGLTGLFDWTLKFNPEAMLQLAAQSGFNVPAGVQMPPSDSPSLLTAVREQLGLKLDSTDGPVEVLVIDSAELPSPD